MKIGIVAGEASGDLLGAGLIQALKKSYPTLSITGVGGPEMIEAGCQSLYPIEKLSLMGLIEPLFHLRELWTIRRGLTQHFLKNPPDVFIGIDAPDFNLGLEFKLRQANIPVVHYVSPSVWAWRKKRIVKIAKAVDLMLTLFPFEADFYKAHEVPVRFVGHPLADKIAFQPMKQAARERLNLLSDKKYIAILPGSRQSEIKHVGNIFLATAAAITKTHPHVEFITSSANEQRHQEFKMQWQQQYSDLPLTFFKRQSHDVMEAADIVLVTSGTATLETMLFKCPMVIAFKAGAISFQIAKWLVDVPFIGLPNLLANELLVPEFLQEKATPKSLSEALLDYLDHPEKIMTLEKKYNELHDQLRCHANEEAADAILQLIKQKIITKEV